MEPSRIEVTDISNLLGEGLPLGKEVDLGNPEINERINALLSGIRKDCKSAYILRWEKGRVPSGAVVGDETLGWTQHGMASNQSGKIVGTYERIVDSGGNSGREHVMVVYMFPNQ